MIWGVRHKCICCLVSVSVSVFAFCNVIELNAAAACDIFTLSIAAGCRLLPPPGFPYSRLLALLPASHRKTSSDAADELKHRLHMYVCVLVCVCICICDCIYAWSWYLTERRRRRRRRRLVANVARPLMKAENEPSPLVIELTRQWDNVTVGPTCCRCFDFSQN